jgi:hypothetical protein
MLPVLLNRNHDSSWDAAAHRFWISRVHGTVFNFHHSTGMWHPHWAPVADLFGLDWPGWPLEVQVPFGCLPYPSDTVCASGWLQAAQLSLLVTVTVPADTAWTRMSQSRSTSPLSLSLPSLSQSPGPLAGVVWASVGQGSSRWRRRWRRVHQILLNQ